MKRDMDLVRNILLQIEGDGKILSIEGYEKDVILKHLELLEEAGLIKASFLRANQVGVVSAHVERLTWSGHEFLDAARNDTLWNKAKGIVGEKAGTVSFAILQILLVQLAKSALGLP
jgi:hypothetical protein